MKGFLAKIKKAGAAFAVPFVGELIRVRADGITYEEAWIAAGIGLVAALAVFGIKNAPWKTPAQ